MVWEYYTLLLSEDDSLPRDPDDLDDPDEQPALGSALHALGAKGWELVSAFMVGNSGVQYIFKRPKDEPDSP